VSIDKSTDKSKDESKDNPAVDLQHGNNLDVVSSSVSPGTLYLVATPIGNLADITSRAVSVLDQVDIIAAEDTRHSQRLLSHLQINTKLVAYHEHNEERAAPRLLDDLEAGKSIAVISDAGTPLISDPGYRLVTQAHDRQLRVVPVPGVSAMITALSAAGLATDAFTFEGFPPAKHGTRLHFFEQLVTQQRTMVFYVSCHRIIDTLKDMQTVFGAGRRLTFARELTKTFETIRRTSLAELNTWVESDDNQRKGEIVLVVEGSIAVASDSQQVDHLLSIMLTELPVKQAVKLVVKITGEHKNDIYKRALELKSE
jgi:16S rRNA (cytidine1402-2'-O)-methyltransferase